MNKILKIILSEPIPETDDNKKALDQLESAEDVLRFKKSGKELADLAWSLEDLNLPPELATDYSREEWESFTRIVTLIFSHK